MVNPKVRVIRLPTPLTCIRRSTCGYALRTICSSLRSHSLIGSVNYSTCFSNGCRLCCISSGNSCICPTPIWSVSQLGNRYPIALLKPLAVFTSAVRASTSAARTRIPSQASGSAPKHALKPFSSLRTALAEPLRRPCQQTIATRLVSQIDSDRNQRLSCLPHLRLPSQCYASSWPVSISALRVRIHWERNAPLPGDRPSHSISGVSILRPQVCSAQPIVGPETPAAMVESARRPTTAARFGHHTRNRADGRFNRNRIAGYELEVLTSRTISSPEDTR